MKKIALISLFCLAQSSFLYSAGGNKRILSWVFGDDHQQELDRMQKLREQWIGSEFPKLKLEREKQQEKQRLERERLTKEAEEARLAKLEQERVEREQREQAEREVQAALLKQQQQEEQRLERERLTKEAEEARLAKLEQERVEREQREQAEREAQVKRGAEVALLKQQQEAEERKVEPVDWKPVWDLEDKIVRYSFKGSTLEDNDKFLREIMKKRKELENRYGIECFVSIDSFLNEISKHIKKQSDPDYAQKEAERQQAALEVEREKTRQQAAATIKAAQERVKKLENLVVPPVDLSPAALQVQQSLAQQQLEQQQLEQQKLALLKQQEEEELRSKKEQERKALQENRPRLNDLEAQARGKIEEFLYARKEWKKAADWADHHVDCKCGEHPVVPSSFKAEFNKFHKTAFLELLESLNGIEAQYGTPLYDEKRRIKRIMENTREDKQYGRIIEFLTKEANKSDNDALRKDEEQLRKAWEVKAKKNVVEVLNTLCVNGEKIEFLGYKEYTEKFVEENINLSKEKLSELLLSMFERLKEGFPEPKYQRSIEGIKNQSDSSEVYSALAELSSQKLFLLLVHTNPTITISSKEAIIRDFLDKYAAQQDDDEWK